MNRRWVFGVTRLAVYLYVAIGLGGLFSRYLFLIVALVLIVLLYATWTSFWRPLSFRRWIPVAVLASLGVARLLLAGGAYPGGGGALS